MYSTVVGRYLVRQNMFLVFYNFSIGMLMTLLSVFLPCVVYFTHSLIQFWCTDTVHIHSHGRMSVCLCVCAKSYECILMELFGGVEHGPRTKRLDFDGNPEPGIFKGFFTIAIAIGSQGWNMKVLGEGMCCNECHLVWFSVSRCKWLSVCSQSWCSLKLI